MPAAAAAFRSFRRGRSKQFSSAAAPPLSPQPPPPLPIPLMAEESTGRRGDDNNRSAADRYSIPPTPLLSLTPTFPSSAAAAAASASFSDAEEDSGDEGTRVDAAPRGGHRRRPPGPRLDVDVDAGLGLDLDGLSPIRPSGSAATESRPRRPLRRAAEAAQTRLWMSSNPSLVEADTLAWQRSTPAAAAAAADNSEDELPELDLEAEVRKALEDDEEFGGRRSSLLSLSDADEDEDGAGGGGSDSGDEHLPASQRFSSSQPPGGLSQRQLREEALNWIWSSKATPGGARGSRRASSSAPRRSRPAAEPTPVTQAKAETKTKAKAKAKVSTGAGRGESRRKRSLAATRGGGDDSDGVPAGRGADSGSGSGSGSSSESDSDAEASLARRWRRRPETAGAAEVAPSRRKPAVDDETPDVDWLGARRAPVAGPIVRATYSKKQRGALAEYDPNQGNHRRPAPVVDSDGRSSGSDDGASTGSQRRRRPKSKAKAPQAAKAKAKAAAAAAAQSSRHLKRLKRYLEEIDDMSLEELVVIEK